VNEEIMSLQDSYFNVIRPFFDYGGLYGFDHMSFSTDMLSVVSFAESMPPAAVMVALIHAINEFNDFTSRPRSDSFHVSLSHGLRVCVKPL
jgi:hypothetical protein